MNIIYQKPNDMLCGSACLYYLCKAFFKRRKLEPIDNKLMWITEIAEYVKNNFDKNAILPCHNSNLYYDYLYAKAENIESFIGFQKIDNYIRGGNKIYDYEITTESIDTLLNTNHIIIMNVSSSIFHQDSSMTGGHYIILLRNDSENYLVVNPGKHNFYVEHHPKESIIKSCHDFGNWIITINCSFKITEKAI